MHTWMALGFVLSLYAALVGAIVAAYIRSPYTVSQSSLYFVNVLVTRLLWRANVPRQLPIPVGQGAVLIANHRSSVDPCFVQLSAGRVMHWMVAGDYFSHPIFGRFLRFCQSIPTRRTGVDIASTKQAIRLAKSGGVIGMFPEGRINQSELFMMDVRPGAAKIALAAGVPLIPCYIEGSPYDGSPAGALTMPANVSMKLGPPIYLDAWRGRENDRQAQAEVILLGIKEIAKLAQHDGFEPKLAGKRWHSLIAQVAEAG